MTELDSLARDFHLLSRKIQQRYATFWSANSPDISRLQYVVLRSIQETPGLEPVDLGTKAAIDKSTLSGILDRLEAQGLVERTVLPADRRRRTLQITASGDAVLPTLITASHLTNKQTFEALALDETRQLIRLLRTVEHGRGS